MKDMGLLAGFAWSADADVRKYLPGIRLSWSGGLLSVEVEALSNEAVLAAEIPLGQVMRLVLISASRASSTPCVSAAVASTSA